MSTSSVTASGTSFATAASGGATLTCAATSVPAAMAPTLACAVDTKSRSGFQFCCVRICVCFVPSLPRTSRCTSTRAVVGRPRSGSTYGVPGSSCE